MILVHHLNNSARSADLSAVRDQARSALERAVPLASAEGSVPGWPGLYAIYSDANIWNELVLGDPPVGQTVVLLRGRGASSRMSRPTTIAVTDPRPEDRDLRLDNNVTTPGGHPRGGLWASASRRSSSRRTSEKSSSNWASKANSLQNQLVGTKTAASSKGTSSKPRSRTAGGCAPHLPAAPRAPDPVRHYFPTE